MTGRLPKNPSLLLLAKSKNVASICRSVPEQIDGAEQRCRPARWVEPDTSPVGFLLDQTGFVQSAGVLGSGGHLDPAFRSDFLHAEGSPRLQQPDHFDSPVVCQTAGQLCPTSVIVRHRKATLARFYFLPKVKTWLWIPRRPA